MSLVALVLLAGLLLILGYRKYLRDSASALLADMKGLTLGQSDYADAMRIAQRYRRFRVIGNASVPASIDPSENVFPANICNLDRCFFEFIVDNRPLSDLHLVHGAAFTAAFAVLHGKVEYIEVHLIGGPPPGVAGGFVEEVDLHSSRPPGYQFRTPVGKAYLRIVLTPSAPTDVRDRAFALNMNCLAAFSDCAKPCDYLPLLWNDWKTTLMRDGWIESLRTTYADCP
ncbi:MAG: hypothetical protein WA655_12635 [Candidatus Korobacteraceae bacterium]